ncbi:PerC family transcriptional regulator [Rahnella aquatilis]|uniref:PerC family transcriptional regulator n=1 Tax=unclassified Sodalis (in: enterobacteria) TaxID=2636512 RepID=UPI0016547129
MRVKDDIAESLEHKGWWHRAARRWLEVLDLTDDDCAREAIARRRDHCFGMVGVISPEQRRRKNRKQYKQQCRFNEGY